MTLGGKTSVWPVALFGLAIIALSAASAFLLFALSEVVRPWIAGGILAAGTAALGLYTAMTLARRS